MLVWLSFDTWFITLLAISYLGGLFVVAYWGQQQSVQQWRSRPWVYSLALGVSCTSWAFYGMVGQVAASGVWLAPLYFGSILCFMLGWPMLLKMLHICKQQNLTSIADFIACRYDRSPTIAGLVAVIALIGTIPYIALQLRAIGASFDLVTGTYLSDHWTTFIVTFVLIIFSMLFGARHVSASKQNQGLVLAIAFSSVIKLLALTVVGIFVTFYLFDGFTDVLTLKLTDQPETTGYTFYPSIAQALLGAITIFILPQQFHMMIIENHHEQELSMARWLYPLFLLLINVFILPIALAGQMIFPGGSVEPDTFVLSIPLYYQQAWLALLVFVGGLAAATSMVIIASIVMSTMLTTEVITPLMIKAKLFPKKEHISLSGFFVKLRRIAIACILLLAFLFDYFFSENSELSSLGLLSFVLLAQFAPAVIGALYWRKATIRAAFWSLIIGACTWAYTLLFPTLLPQADWVLNGPFAISWLIPTSLLGVTDLDFVSHGVFCSLLMNSLCYIFLSLLSSLTVGEKLQAELFLSQGDDEEKRHLTVVDLYHLLRRFIDQQTADLLLEKLSSKKQQRKVASAELIDFTQRNLAGVLGSASTRMVMKAASNSQEMQLADVASIVDEASQLFQFNQELLQAGIEHIEQGMSVVDADMRLVAWNQRYIELLDIPADIMVVGMPIADLLRLNIIRGLIVGNEANDMVKRRIAHMKAGHRHYHQRVLPNGIVIEIRGQAMPRGGFVSTFSDISMHIETEKLLQNANEGLEKSVAERTEQLMRAKAEAEAANQSKTRFLAAASHDLMQPFNALSLFTDMLKKKVASTELVQLANHIGDSVVVVEALLSDLVEISRLDSSAQKIAEKSFALDDLLRPLHNEITVLAAQENIDFTYCHSDCYVYSDQKMLRRIIQNFLSNAVHYCPNGRIVLGVRRLANKLRIEVWDNGPGIALDKQESIFREFERLDQSREVPGLGLGLAISQRIANLLNLSISLRSVPGKGSVFAVEVPRANPEIAEIPLTTRVQDKKSVSKFIGKKLLLIDNDNLMLTAISSLLTEWGCQVLTAKDPAGLGKKLIEYDTTPDLIIADYHLDEQLTGVALIEQLLTDKAWSIPCIICSADPSEQVRDHTSEAGFYFMGKPLKAIALKKLMRGLLEC